MNEMLSLVRRPEPSILDLGALPRAPVHALSLLGALPPVPDTFAPNELPVLQTIAAVTAACRGGAQREVQQPEELRQVA